MGRKSLNMGKPHKNPLNMGHKPPSYGALNPLIWGNPIKVSLIWDINPLHMEEKPFIWGTEPLNMRKPHKNILNMGHKPPSYGGKALHMEH